MLWPLRLDSLVSLPSFTTQHTTATSKSDGSESEHLSRIHCSGLVWPKSSALRSDGAIVWNKRVIPCWSVICWNSFITAVLRLLVNLAFVVEKQVYFQPKSMFREPANYTHLIKQIRSINCLSLFTRKQPNVPTVRQLYPPTSLPLNPRCTWIFLSHGERLYGCRTVFFLWLQHWSDYIVCSTVKHIM